MFGTGSTTVTMDDEFEALVRRAVDEMLPGMTERLEATAARLESDARARWPVRTGQSRDALGHEVRVAQDFGSIRARVYCSADYAKFIVSAKIRSGSGSAFVELMRRPTEAAALVLADELRTVTSRALGGA